MTPRIGQVVWFSERDIKRLDYLSIVKPGYYIVVGVTTTDVRLDRKPWHSSIENDRNITFSGYSEPGDEHRFMYFL